MPDDQQPVIKGFPFRRCDFFRNLEWVADRSIARVSPFTHKGARVGATDAFEVESGPFGTAEIDRRHRTRNVLGRGDPTREASVVTRLGENQRLGGAQVPPRHRLQVGAQMLKPFGTGELESLAP